MVLTQSESQRSVMGVLWLIKAPFFFFLGTVIPSFFPSLFHSLRSSSPCRLTLTLAHIRGGGAGFRCHQSHLDPRSQSSANRGSVSEDPRHFAFFLSFFSGIWTAGQSTDLSPRWAGSGVTLDCMSGARRTLNIPGGEGGAGLVSRLDFFF